MSIIQVVRVLIMEGPEEWIEEVLDYSWVQPGDAGSKSIGGGKIVEVARVQQEIPAIPIPEVPE